MIFGSFYAIIYDYQKKIKKEEVHEKIGSIACDDIGTLGAGSGRY